MTMYKVQLAEFQKQADEFKAFSHPFMCALPQHVITDLDAHFGTSLVNRTFEQIITRLRAKYGVMITTEVLHELHEQFNVPYNGDEDLDKFIHTHIQLHNELNSHGSSLNNYEKTEKLKASLTPSTWHSPYFKMPTVTQPLQPSPHSLKPCKPSGKLTSPGPPLLVMPLPQPPTSNLSLTSTKHYVTG